MADDSTGILDGNMETFGCLWDQSHRGTYEDQRILAARGQLARQPLKSRPLEKAPASALRVECATYQVTHQRLTKQEMLSALKKKQLLSFFLRYLVT